ncbi:PCRF domain-containing protein, partial [Candidatus Azambacteria bacterium]|nr:PCRF domain-containing protein [Candidatus Azambacteria bacterium]
MNERLEALKIEHRDIGQQLTVREAVFDLKAQRTLAKRHAELGEIIEKYERLENIKKEIADNEDILKTEKDAAMIALAQEELARNHKKEATIEEEIADFLSPSTHGTYKHAIVEIRAGTGGEEAALFAAQLYRMYTRYAHNRGWKAALIDSSQTPLGGFKEVVFELSGARVYADMRFESGVHRVQRIPETEKQGRIHTSTVSVAVLPEVEESEITINPSDLRVETYRAGGPGG